MKQTEMKKSQTCASPSIHLSCTDIPDCMTGEEIRIAVPDGEHIGMLSYHILQSWPFTKAEEQTDLQPYWSFRDGFAIIASNAMKGRGIVIPVALQDKALNNCT